MRIVDAWRGMRISAKLVVVGDPPQEMHEDGVHFAGRISEAELRWAYANAEALISVSREDFGLTPVEANSFGTPVLVIRRGGFLDSTDEGVSGMFIEDDAISSIRDAVEAFPSAWDRQAIIAHARKFSKERFAERLKVAVDRAIDQHRPNRHDQAR
ncbi:glycosyltransferase involved in cell wall biosynthesis [Curtobacterium sp. 1310]|nr:glycosyltransferase involved in cell wall biosynthesis [Curtobacterium sp. 1310]